MVSTHVIYRYANISTIIGSDGWFIGSFGLLQELTSQICSLFYFVTRDQDVLKIKISRTRVTTILEYSYVESLTVQLLLFSYYRLHH